MNIPVFETDTNVIGVDKITSADVLMNGENFVQTYTSDSPTLLLSSIAVVIFFFSPLAVLTFIYIEEAKRGKSINLKKVGGAVLVFAVIAGALFTFLQAGVVDTTDKKSVLGYYDKDKVTVEKIQGSWLYKNHDFVQDEVKKNDTLNGYDIHCEDEMKIPEQEKRSVLCGGDVLSPVTAKDKKSDTSYELLANFRVDYEPPTDNFDESKKDEENPVHLLMAVERKLV